MKNVKTAKEWFLETLPKTVALKAIRNTNPSKLNELHEFPHFALLSSFIWADTKNGNDPQSYWKKQYCKVKEKYKQANKI